MDGGYINEEDSDAIIEVDSPGGQLKKKNGQNQKYVVNDSQDGIFISKTCALLGVIIALLVVLVAIVITYLLSSGVPNEPSPCGLVSSPIALTSDIPIATNEVNIADKKLELYRGWYPQIYKLTIEPNLHTSTNNGSIAVEIKRDKNVKELLPIVFDLNNITINSAKVYDLTGDPIEITQEYGDNNDSYIISIIGPIDLMDSNLTLYVQMEFTSQLSNTLQGIYKTSYLNMDTGKMEWMISTQFSPIDARRGFPCFDRPDMKANFSLTLIYEEDKASVLSNMPPFEKTVIRPGYLKQTFQTTPKIPTYLIAFTISNLVKSNFTDVDIGTLPKINIWTRPESTSMTKYAYALTKHVLPFFEDYFGIPYQLPKIDLVSIPDFGFEAMENWGLITFRDSSLLVPNEDDHKSSSAAHTEYSASIIVHELAHQWFGNLVTPKWWNDLWLKEGFASYMSYVALNEVNPKWKLLETFTVTEFQQSMAKDSDKSSNPITFSVESANDIRRIFNPISYSKGTILLRMVNSMIGEEAFKSAIQDFLRKFAFGNADRDQLWETMTWHGHRLKTLPKDLHIKEIMDTWTKQAGYPVVTVQRKGVDLVITQERYMLPQKNNTDYSRWYIPITYETDEMRKGHNVPTHWLTDNDKMIVVKDVFSNANNTNNVVYLNLNRQGYYRVNYDYPSWIALKNKFKELPSIIRAQLLDDSLHLAKSEYLSYDVPLTFLMEMFDAHDDEILWSSAQQGLKYLIYMLQREPAYESFRAFMRFIVRPAFDRYALEEPDDETHTELLHRSHVVRLACKFNYDRCTNAAQLKYRRWMSNPSDNIIKPNLKEVIYCTSLSEGSFQEWYFAYKQYKKTSSASEKEQILSALGCTAKPWLLAKYLNMTIDPESGIQKQDGGRAFSAVARNPIGYEIAFDFLSTNIQEISKYFGDGFSTINDMIDSITSFMNKDYHMEQLEHFRLTAVNLNLTSVVTAIDAAKENVNNNIFWRKRSYYKLKTFLETLVSEFRINLY